MSSSNKMNGYSDASRRHAMGESVRDGSTATQEVDDCKRATGLAPINPFIHRLQLSTLEKIQIGLMTVTLFPIRLILIGICLLFAWFFAFLALLGRSKEDEKKPMTGWRRLLRPFAIFFARGLFFMGGFHWVTVKGKRASAAEAPILATAPHSSYMDALSVSYLGLTSVVAKTEAEDMPFFGTLTKFTQPVLVSREDPSSRQNTIREIQRRAATGGEWPQIIIFTEGTCTNRRCLINFKPGAFIPGVPVQPVCLKYKNKLDTITWTWKGPAAFRVLWLTLCQFHSNFEIEFLPVYVPSEEEKTDIKLFGRNVRAQMARALGVPVTENSFEDGQAMMNAVRLHLPIAEDLVYVNRITRQLGIKPEVLREHLPELCASVRSSPSSIFLTLEEFAALLRSSSSSDPLRELFSVYQKAGENVVDLRRYLVIFHLLCLPQSIEDVLRFSFDIYDYTSKGFLSVQELNEMLTTFGLPPVKIALLSDFGDGPELQITYEMLKARLEKLPEYGELLDQSKSTNQKRDASKAANPDRRKQE